MGMLGIIASQQVGVPTQVVAPKINDVLIMYDGIGWNFSWVVTNMDSQAAVIYSEGNDTTPDVSMGTINPGSSTATITYSRVTNIATAYAQATVSGRTNSIVVSEYMEGYVEP